jgi:hypothetical protein
MSTLQENLSRIKGYFRFNRQELSGLVVAILVTGFIFSFRDWGVDQFELTTGLRNMAILCLVTAITFFFRISVQKIYGLSQGHKAEFKVWWMGLLIALVVAFFSFGRIPLVLLGGTFVAFMIRHRIGEYRYGISYWVNGSVAYWGVMGNLALAILFGMGNYFVPGNYFFQKGLTLNIIMAVGALIPIPQLDGLNIYMGARFLYYTGVVLVLLAAVLLLSKTLIGLIMAAVIGVGYFITYQLISSEV